MRVLVVTSSAPWFVRDGGTLVLEEHLRRLANEHEITLFAPGAPGAEAPVPPLPYRAAARWFGTRIPRALDYVARKARALVRGEPAHVDWVERGRLVDALREEVARRPPAVLHLHGWGTAQLSRLAPHITSIHVAVDAWSLGARNRLLPRWRAALDRALEPRLEAAVAAHERRHYARCKAVVVVSDLDAMHLRRTVAGIRVEVVPIGIDAGASPPPPPSDPVLGFHGAFGTAANRDAALTLARDVFPHVRDAHPDARLLIIGRDPGPDVRALQRDGVVVTGEVDDVRAWLERVAVYVAPMVSGTGMKNKVLEAMAAGRPVVASPRALEGIGEGPGVLVGDSPRALADHVLSLLASPQRIAEMGRDARRRAVSGFSWDRSADAIDRLWREAAT